MWLLIVKHSDSIATSQVTIMMLIAFTWMRRVLFSYVDSSTDAGRRRPWTRSVFSYTHNRQHISFVLKCQRAILPIARRRHREAVFGIRLTISIIATSRSFWPPIVIVADSFRFIIAKLIPQRLVKLNKSFVYLNISHVEDVLNEIIKTDAESTTCLSVY